MDHRASTSEISEFLTRIQRLLAANKCVFVRRDKNMQALTKHCLTFSDVTDEMLELDVSNYYKGPKKDFDPNQPGDIWEFKKSIDGIQFYMKLKIVEEGGNEILKCLSFHEDNFA